MSRRGRLFAAALLLALAACTTSAPPRRDDAPPAPEGASGLTSQHGAYATKAMVAAANPLAAEAGQRMLRAGGSAVDAAIAVQMMLTLVEPQSSGIGGGLFLVHHDGRQVQAYDGRETAPAAATPELFLRGGTPMAFDDAVTGGRSVGTPGVLRALELAHRRHGRLPWRTLFEPAIERAEQGFLISPRLATLLARAGAQRLRDDPTAAAYFFAADGSPKRAGTLLRNPELAALLRAVASQGVDAFYRGPVARDLVAKVRGHANNPGLLDENDLAGYRAVERTPLCFEHRRWRLCGMPPPSSGTIAIAQMLGMLAGSDLAAARPQPAPWGLEPSVAAVHLVSEAGRLAYADRNRYVADTDFAPLPGLGVQSLIDAEYLRRRAALIGPRSMGRAEPGMPLGAAVAWADDSSPERPSTSHVSVVDAHGNGLAMTTTIENEFGAKLMVHGFLLNNQLTDFSFAPQEDGRPVANRVQGGKRPRSSMAPLLVFERDSGSLMMSVGSPGGSAIINYVAKVLIGTLEWQLDVQQAISLPNFGSRNGPTELESGQASAALIEGLQARGHEVRLITQTSGLQGIARVMRDGRPAWFGGADPRREGAALGD